MKENEYFIINSIDELKQAYEMFGGNWCYSLEEEIKYFNKGYRYLKYNYDTIYLGGHVANKCTEIKSPINNTNNLNKLI